MNDSFCAYPFVHSHVSATYTRKVCCVSPELPEFNKLSTDDYWNSDYIKQMRLDMIEGKPISGCEFCIHFEQSGGRSLRNKINVEFDVEHLIANTNSDGSLDLKPSFYDYRSTLCNFQCITCDENHSSMHKKLSAKLGISKNNHTIDLEYEAKLAQEIINGLEAKAVKMLYWAGGEPMLMKLHWDVVDKMEELYLLDDYKEYITSIPVFYNTNMSRIFYKNHHIPNRLSKFNVTMWASLDGVRETHMYCRDGADWEITKKNWNEYKKHITNLGVTSVLTAPVIMDIDRYIEFLQKEQCDFFDHEYLPIGFNPFLDIRVYPEELFNKVIDNAIAKLEAAELNQSNKNNSIAILKKYIVDRRSTAEVDYVSAKKDVSKRDKHLVFGMKFHELLELVNTDCAEWYNSIEVV